MIIIYICKKTNAFTNLPVGKGGKMLWHTV